VARAKANGIEVEYETAGNKSDPALLPAVSYSTSMPLA